MQQVCNEMCWLTKFKLLMIEPIFSRLLAILKVNGFSFIISHVHVDTHSNTNK